jgi:hypothetical protein
MSDPDIAQLVTCIVSREDETWAVTWASDGPTPADYSGDSITPVTERAAAEVASMYVDRSAGSEAELQFAIYPWADGGNVILNIEWSADGFAARDIQGSGAFVQGSTLEELVLEAERRLPTTRGAMLRWIRPVGELIEEYGEGDADLGGFDPMAAAAAVAERLGASGIPVTAADVVTVMSTHAELTGHGDPETDHAERSTAVARVADATGRSLDVVARIYDEVERYVHLHRPKN